MYRVLIVDDEIIELEGLEKLIPWNELGIEVMGKATNGKQAYEMIEKDQPDIVLTDIQMPIMNGIELLKNTREYFPDIEFIIISGYGEYEYTSKAMYEGVRHYVLKPFDESKVMDAIKTVIEKLETKESENTRHRDEIREVNQLKVKARQQIFRDILSKHSFVEDNCDKLKNQMDSTVDKFRLLLIYKNRPFDNLEEFIVVNILNEVLENDPEVDGVYVSATIKNFVALLIRDYEVDCVKEAVSVLAEKMMVLTKDTINGALSQLGGYYDIQNIYNDTVSLLTLIENDRRTLFISKDEQGFSKNDLFIDYQSFKNCNSYPKLAYLLYLLFIKMNLRKKTKDEQIYICKLVLGLFDKEDISIHKDLSDREIYDLMLDQLSDIVDVTEKSKELERDKLIIKEAYHNISNIDLGLNVLASDIMFMSDDYLGKCFRKRWGMKFTQFLQESRINLAKDIIDFEPNIKIADVACMTGFLEDGQYFSKVFKKLVGISPSEYKQKALDKA